MLNGCVCQRRVRLAVWVLAGSALLNFGLLVCVLFVIAKGNGSGILTAEERQIVRELAAESERLRELLSHDHDHR